MAPSLIGEELPAVTVPPVLKADFSAASGSTVVSGRSDSSRPTPSTSITKPSCRPLLACRVARAGASGPPRRPARPGRCRARRRPARRTPRASPVQSAGNFGLTIRQPSCVWMQLHRLRAAPRRASGSTYGDRLMLSTPPAITSRASPTAHGPRRLNQRLLPEAHSRLTDTPEPSPEGRRAGPPSWRRCGCPRRRRSCCRRDVVDRRRVERRVAVDQLGEGIAARSSVRMATGRRGCARTGCGRRRAGRRRHMSPS